MTNKNIRYELFECIATTSIITERMGVNIDVISMETMKERLVALFNYFDYLYKKEQKQIDKELDNILNQ